MGVSLPKFEQAAWTYSICLREIRINLHRRMNSLPYIVQFRPAVNLTFCFWEFRTREGTFTFHESCKSVQLQSKILYVWLYVYVCEGDYQQTFLQSAWISVFPFKGWSTCAALDCMCDLIQERSWEKLKAIISQSWKEWIPFITTCHQHLCQPSPLRFKAEVLPF